MLQGATATYEQVLGALRTGIDAARTHVREVHPTREADGQLADVYFANSEVGAAARLIEDFRFGHELSGAQVEDLRWVTRALGDANRGLKGIRAVDGELAEGAVELQAQVDDSLRVALVRAERAAPSFPADVAEVVTPAQAATDAVADTVQLALAGSSVKWTDKQRSRLDAVVAEVGGGTDVAATMRAVRNEMTGDWSIDQVTTAMVGAARGGRSAEEAASVIAEALAGFGESWTAAQQVEVAAAALASPHRRLGDIQALVHELLVATAPLNDNGRRVAFTAAAISGGRSSQGAVHVYNAVKEAFGEGWGTEIDQVAFAGLAGTRPSEQEVVHALLRADDASLPKATRLAQMARAAAERPYGPGSAAYIPAAPKS